MTFHKISNNEYHNGEEWGDRLNASAIKLLVNATPAHFALARRTKTEPTRPMIVGSAVHAAILEPETFEEEYAALPDVDGRTKAGKIAIAAAKEAKPGAVMLRYNEWEEIHAMTESVARHGPASNFLKGCPERETSLQWTEEWFGGAACKIRPDAFGFASKNQAANLILDVKTTTKNAMTFQYAAKDLGYFIQASWYRRGMKKVTGEDFHFVFIVVEKEPPHCVSVQWIDGSTSALCDAAVQHAGRLYQDCVSAGEWPGWPEKSMEIGLTTGEFERLCGFCNQ